MSSTYAKRTPTRKFETKSFAENRFSHEDQISGLNFILIT